MKTFWKFVPSSFISRFSCDYLIIFMCAICLNWKHLNECINLHQKGNFKVIVNIISSLDNVYNLNGT